jgi:hypothetical protein
MRRIGVLMAATADDPEYQPRMKAFQQGLALLGWIDGGVKFESPGFAMSQAAPTT